MTLRLGIAVAICLCFTGGVGAQVVRFETTAGDFDMVLNPTNNPVLQGHVNNMLAYVDAESYKGSWINRASAGFVLQMGGFYSETKRPSLTIDSVLSVRSFNPVQGEPAAQNPPLSNTVGTVALALSGSASGTDQNSGSSSFFVNVGNNSSLDQDFTVFAAIPDMTVVNKIMAMTNIDRTQDSLFGADPGNLAFNTVPVQDDGYQVLIKRAFVITDAMTITSEESAVQSVMSQSAQNFGGAPDSVVPASAAGLTTSPGLSQNVVPEPATLTMALASLLGLGFFTLRRRSR